MHNYERIRIINSSSQLWVCDADLSIRIVLLIFRNFHSFFPVTCPQSLVLRPMVLLRDISQHLLRWTQHPVKHDAARRKLSRWSDSRRDLSHLTYIPLNWPRKATCVLLTCWTISRRDIADCRLWSDSGVDQQYQKRWRSHCKLLSTQSYTHLQVQSTQLQLFSGAMVSKCVKQNAKRLESLQGIIRMAPFHAIASKFQVRVEVSFLVSWHYNCYRCEPCKTKNYRRFLPLIWKWFIPLIYKFHKTMAILRKS